MKRAYQNFQSCSKNKKRVQLEMNKEIFMNLMNNRMLRDNDEIEGYERNLETLAGSFSEEDIIELCLTFDDKTQSAEIMYSAIRNSFV